MTTQQYSALPLSESEYSEAAPSPSVIGEADDSAIGKDEDTVGTPEGSAEAADEGPFGAIGATSVSSPGPGTDSLGVLLNLSRDARLLIASKSIRMLSYGFLAVMLVIYLEELSFSAEKIGLLLSLTMLGDVFVSMYLATSADRFGRRKTLLIGSGLALVTSCIFAVSNNFWTLLLAAIFGVISPSGSEIGPFMAVEISSLVEVTSSADRTMLLAWYNLFSCFASAFGAVICGVLMDQLRIHFSYSLMQACQFVLLLYAGLQVAQMALFALLSDDIEVKLALAASAPAGKAPVGSFLGLHKSKMVVLKLSALFLLDSFGGSFILQSVVSGWFHDTYQTSISTLGVLVFVCNLVAGISALFAAKLADTIGLVMTMVVTHLPSNFLIILVPLMPNEALAIAVLCARYSISQMDVPTRNAYVAGVVAADERSAASAVTSVVRSVGAASGPFLAGLLYARPQLRSYPFFIAGGVKVAYDLLLLWSMSGTPTEDEEKKQQEQEQKEQQQQKQKQGVEMVERENGHSMNKV